MPSLSIYNVLKIHGNFKLHDLDGRWMMPSHLKSQNYEEDKSPRRDGKVRLIESTHLKFALTGSSARKLKRGAANLLAGRAFVNHLYPLVHQELGEQFDLQSALQWGTLPKIFQLTTGAERREYLKAC